jgi:TonB family protein
MFMRRTFALLLASSCTMVSFAAQPSAAATATTNNPSEATLQNWDREQLELRESVWDLYAGTASFGKDARGRTLSEDLGEWVMTPETCAKLKAARSQAEQQLKSGDESATQATLEGVQGIVAEQKERVALISLYWSQQALLARHRALWQTWLGSAPADLISPSKIRINALENSLLHDYSPEKPTPELGLEIEALKLAYNEERLKLAAAASTQGSAAGRILLSRDRDIPCPGVLSHAPGAPGPSNSPPAIVAASNTEEFYPSEASKNRISGKIILELTIAADGCMKHAAVAGSSGAPELDDAAIDVAERSTYSPARSAGQPITGSFKVAFDFKLADDSSPAGSGNNSGTGSEHFKRGMRLLNNGNFPGAITEFDATLEVNPADAMAFAQRGTAHAYSHEDELARRDFDSASAIDPRNIAVFPGRGILAMKNRDFGEAIAAFTTALAINPNNEPTLELRAEAYSRAGDLEHALEDSADALRLFPTRLPLYSKRARFLRLQGKFEESVQQARDVILANPTDYRAYMTAADIYGGAGKEAEARQAMDEAVSMSPTEATYLQRAKQRSRSDLAGRRADIESALKLNPDSAPGTVALVQLQLDSADYKAAIQTTTAALAARSTDISLLLRRAIAYQKDDQDSLAQWDLKTARAVAVSASSLNNVCWTLATANIALEQALDACDAAIAKDPLEAMYLDSRGFVLLRLGRYGEALDSYNEALKSAPTEFNSLYGRAIAEQRQHDTQRADADVAAALALDARVAESFSAYGVVTQPASAGH